MKNFWQKLQKPISALAPMAGVTDSAFRSICKDFGADVVYSEMASVTALAYNPGETLAMLKFSKKERPYVVQLFGSNPEHFAIAARLITKKIKPDGIDINFGCPVKKVQKQGAGAILMSDLDLSYKVIKSVIENTDLPVSVKCRISVGKITVNDFLKKIKDLDVKALMIHGRSMSQGHAGEVDVRAIRNARKFFKGVILANGGIRSASDASLLLEKTKADGVGIAQGAMGRPWIFEGKKEKVTAWTRVEIFKAALRHSKLAYKLKGKPGIIEMRKHLCWYVSGLPDASELRKRLVTVEKVTDIEKILKTKNPA